MTAMPPPDTLRLSRAELDRAIPVMASIAPFRVPLFRAIRDFRLALLEVRRGQPWPKRALRQLADRPTVVILADDDYASTGPAAFPAARKAAAWARWAMVHAAGGEEAHYTLAVGAALI